MTSRACSHNPCAPYHMAQSHKPIPLMCMFFSIFIIVHLSRSLKTDGTQLPTHHNEFSRGVVRPLQSQKIAILLLVISEWSATISLNVWILYFWENNVCCSFLYADEKFIAILLSNSVHDKKTHSVGCFFYQNNRLSASVEISYTNLCKVQKSSSFTLQTSPNSSWPFIQNSHDHS